MPLLCFLHDKGFLGLIFSLVESTVVCFFFEWLEGQKRVLKKRLTSSITMHFERSAVCVSGFYGAPLHESQYYRLFFWL